MTKLLPLVWANLRRNLRRSILTMLSVALALFLFGTLRSVITTLDGYTAVGSEARLVVRNKISLVFPLPMSYLERIRGMDGVTAVTWQNWFGGTYIDERNFFSRFAIDPESFLAMYPELSVPADQKAAFLADRTGALVGPKLIRKYGWKMGQQVSMEGTIYPGDWKFTVRGMYTPSDPSLGEDVFYFHYDYLDEGIGRAGIVGVYIVSLADPDQAAAMSQKIDALFENSSASSKTETEKAFQAGFIGMWGNISFLLSMIGSAVFFAILLVAANTMMMAARERTREMGVLKTLGFDDGTVFGLVLTESILLTGLGGILGIGGAKALFVLTKFDAGGMLPGFGVEWSTVIVGLAIALGLGLLSGLVPAYQASRLSVVQALKKVA